MPSRWRRAARGAAGLLLLSSLLSVARPASADPFQDRVDRAGALAQAERFKEALAELQAAYAERQSPRLLYMIAKTHQRLGDADAALDAYQRFLAADPEADARLRGDARRQVAELRKLLGKEPLMMAPEAPSGEVERPPTEMHYEDRPRTGLIAGGAVLFGAAYIPALVVGSLTLAAGSGCQTFDGVAGFNACPNGNVQQAGGTLLIPVLGPIFSAFLYRDPVWSTLWTLVDDAAQIGGLAMIIYGAKNPKKVAVYGRDFQILPMMGGHGRVGVQAIGSF